VEGRGKDRGLTPSLSWRIVSSLGGLSVHLYLEVVATFGSCYFL